MEGSEGGCVCVNVLLVPLLTNEERNQFSKYFNRVKKKWLLQGCFMAVRALWLWFS